MTEIFIFQNLFPWLYHFTLNPQAKGSWVPLLVLRYKGKKNFFHIPWYWQFFSDGFRHKATIHPSRWSLLKKKVFFVFVIIWWYLILLHTSMGNRRTSESKFKPWKNGRMKWKKMHIEKKCRSTTSDRNFFWICQSKIVTTYIVMLI